MQGLALLIGIIVVSYLAIGWEGIGIVVVALVVSFFLIRGTERFADRVEEGGGGRLGERIREERRRRDEKDDET